MAGKQVHLAVDLGASSGRVVAGIWDGGRLELQEVYRFDNGGVLVGQRLYWDLLGLWQRTKEGLRAASEKWGSAVRTVGVDTWGVDFGLLDARGDLLSNPIHYRDRQTQDVMEAAFSQVPRERIFQETGIQFLPFNTLYQWLAMRGRGSRLLEQADVFLMMPDLFHWLLCGEKVNEYTNATTTQFYNSRMGRWAFELLHAFRLPTHLLGPVVQPGERLGRLLPQVADEVQLSDAEIVVPGTHDTASAVAAVPATVSGATHAPDWCYISSGTWSLLGVEVAQPVISSACATYNFTNEGGIGGTIRLLKNISGLWLVQECRRIWKLRGRDYSWDDLVQQAAREPAGRSLINPDDARFLAPANMPEEIREFCRQTGQPVPDTDAAVVRCALDSLALRYRMVLEWAESLVANALHTIHIVGGGVQNRLLCQLTADVCRRRVLAGPVEATALGNIAVQAMSVGVFDDINEARAVIRESFPPQEYTPREETDYEELYHRFGRICDGG